MNRNERRNPRLAMARAVALQRAGQLDAAEALVREVLAREPRRAEAAHLLGFLRYQQGDLGEARQMLERAVAAAPADADAWRNLGNVCLDGGAPERAEACFRKVLETRPGDVPARGNLALILERSGRVEEALGELRALRRLAPGDVAALSLLAKLLRRQQQHEEEVVVARELVRLRPGDAGTRGALSRSFYLWFDANDHDREKAGRVLAEWAAFDPEDPVARHMLAAHTAAPPPPRAPDGYVEHHFDAFAATFDEVLASLDYRGPELVEQALRRADPTPRKRLAAVDLGCGTGQCGPRIAPWVRRLTGVDLSQKMLDQARARGAYDALVHEELTAFLAQRPGAFDLAVCADTLPYFGDLGPIFGAVARALAPGGRFIGTVEAREGGTFELLLSGRYAHDAGYVAGALAGAGLTVERIAPEDLRMERGAITKGLVLVARRGGSDPP